MAKKHKYPQPTVATRDLVDHGNGIYASSAETAEYIAQMCTELRVLAKSSADYVAAMTCELATLARSAKLERLTILLDEARKEAETAI